MWLYFQDLEYSFTHPQVVTLRLPNHVGSTLVCISLRSSVESAYIKSLALLVDSGLCGLVASKQRPPSRGLYRDRAVAFFSKISLNPLSSCIA
jgi:hypothetical protein